MTARARPAAAKPAKIPLEIASWAKQKASPRATNPFVIPDAPPGVVPLGGKTLAMDDAIAAPFAWASTAYGSMFEEGLTFLGYPYLAELSQRPEYRRISEIIATEMTRKWIKLRAKGEEDKSEVIDHLTDAMNRLRVREAFRRAATHDGLFGISHLYLDFGVDPDDREELGTSVGCGNDEISLSKVGKGDLKELKTLEAVWCYPAKYTAANPLRDDWYKPQAWFVMGQEIHASRMLTFVGREVPDILKPAYLFGGLSMSQIAKPYVDNWLRTRQSVSDLVHNFSVSGIKTALDAMLSAGSDEFLKRVHMLRDCRDNKGVMVLNKDTEEFFNVVTPLGGLNELQAQSQEQTCSIAGIPVVKLLGVQPAGLNASSQGEITSFYDWIEAYQEALFRPKLETVINFVQLSECGGIDPDITFDFEPLEAMNKKEQAEIEKIEAETDQLLIDSGVIAPAEARARIAAKPETPYQGLDVEEVPSLKEEEEAGLEPRGGRGSFGGGSEDAFFPPLNGEGR